MTKLDELIKEQRDAAQKYLDAISRIDPLVYCDDDEVMDEKEETLRYIANHHNEIADHLEELKTTRNELDVYKRALELTARLLCDFDYCGEFGRDCEACTCKMADEYLQKAREEE